MGPTDWIATLGALAWTPHVYSAIKGAMTKPSVRIITSRVAEVGFTTFGTILNVRMAFSVEHKDLVISGLRIKLRHDDGDERIFEWQGIRQQVLQMTTPDGSVMPYEKPQSVLAIKLNQKDVEERHIQCQEIAFISAKSDYEEIAMKKLSYLKQQERYDAADFLGCQEMVDLYNFIKRSFSWKAGQYFVSIELESTVPFSLIDSRYQFNLTPIDIEELEKNKQSIELGYKNAFVPETPQPAWNWRNPSLRKLS